ncbi:MAG: serpin family protein [Candidatus Thermoplasmatota archaeon]|nr:serpin family protein [Candidatus Thermoplasmatota archaeon]
MSRLRDIFGVIRGQSKAIAVSTDKSIYEVGEKVVIEIRNTGSSVLEGTPSYEIYDDTGKAIYSPMMAQMIRTLGVNETISYTWNQIDNNGKQVKEGLYRVEASFAGLKKEAEFGIKHGVDDSGWTPEGVDRVVDANNLFALDLFSQLKKKNESGNIFFSPYSISVALTMTYEGARGETAEEMENLLHIPEDDYIRRQNFARIINEINREDKKYELSTANALWAQKNYNFLEEYLKIVEMYYGGRVTNLDFVGETEESRQTINRWVEEQTNNRIKELLHEGDIDLLTRLVLTNAIYFKGRWLLQFDPEDTMELKFTSIDGEKKSAPMMRVKGEFNYGETDEGQILEMLYEDEDLSMVFILPEDIRSAEENLTPEKLSEWKDAMVKQEVEVLIPRFKLETRYNMKETLKEMDMILPFSDDADFSGMDGTHHLKIDNVIHQAFIEVTEEGSEAAAATAVVIVAMGMPTVPVFRADHPFIFLIQQRDTGSILFMGRVGDPGA